jgi:broad specificity phosphatase PhoE
MANPKTDKSRRRRRRRIQVIILYTAIAVGLAWFFESQATTTVLFVRHAEQLELPADDPGLSEAGQRRAAELARQLVDADVVAGIDAVYSTPFRRSVETARPVANALDLTVRSYDVADTEEFIEALVKEHKGKIVLVVGHSHTLPEIIGNMGASKVVPPIATDEFDNIYLVSIPWFGKTKTIRLRYGEPYAP